MAATVSPSSLTLSARLIASLRAAWTARQTPWWIVVFAAVAFALRKPWALHTPQLYAEDACIFLVQQEQFGFRAVLEPYMGYLHTLPRLIAWFAAATADPAWWPAVYSGSSFAITIALFFRIASPRFDVPGKPVLLLAFAFAAHTGEVPLNITNLQWISAFFMLIQPLLSAPTRLVDRVADFTILLLVGLTGPFSVILLPVYVWAWWRDRRLATFLPLLLVAACAAIQLHFIVQAGPNSAAPGEPFHPLQFFSVIGSRLFIWSFLGPALLAPLSNVVRAVVAVTAFVGLGFWALRDQPRRSQHVLLFLGFFLISAACFFRTRHDTWGTDNLADGDRYFYISRVLLFWFLAWACTSVRRGVAWTATALVIVGFAVHLPAFRYAAPPDFHWADHCDPIRRGVPAKIPILPAGWDVDYPGRPVR
ncbi:MAG: hypothetical protein NTV51_07775 [Verrucomicrobia bacterium]|nr:hypothetical protein [Verrucomicrobiota bacterium]